MAGDGEEATYEYTSTWAFAVVYTVIVGISYGFERLLHCGGELLMDKRKKALFEALQKIKEELMLLGFVSLLLTLSETRISKICISRDLTLHMLPCWKKHDNSGDNTGYCTDDSKVPLMSVKAIHDLHIFIFILAVVHVIYCILTEFIGRLKIRPWMQWNGTYQRGQQPRNIHVLKVLWYSFCKQFYGSVSESDYKTLKHVFERIRQPNPGFSFYEYMIEVLEDDFRQVVGISWYLWIFVVIFFLLNVKGWYTYFWIAFIPFLILLAVGTMLEHVLIHLVHEVANQSIDLQSVDHFWFIQPKYVLILIHFILFQNSFEIAFFFWMWLKASYSVDACAMGEPSYIVIRLVTGAVIQFLCSYNTLPVYALVTQMGEHHYNKAIFDELQPRQVENPPQERPH